MTSVSLASYFAIIILVKMMTDKDILSLPFYARDFLMYMSTIRNKSQNTVKEYFYDLRLFLKYIHIKNTNPAKILKITDEDLEHINIDGMTLDEIKKVSLSDMYAFMSYVSSVRDNSARARARKVAAIRSLFNYLYNKVHLLDVNPASELESPKIMKQLPKYLSFSESKDLLNSVKGKHESRDYCILTFFLNCGFRVSELVSVNMSNIKNDTLTVVGKGNKERTVYLNSAALSSLKNYLLDRPVDGIIDKDALFISERKQRISVKTVQYIVKKYIGQSGLDPKRYSAHKLRHTAATLMYKYGNVDIRSLQGILGHESIATTEIYTHIDEKGLKDAVGKNPLASFVKDN
jgi:integrase/recombinase XerD